MQNNRHCLKTTRIKIKKKWLHQWECFNNQHFMDMKIFKKKGNWSPYELLNYIGLLVNSCLAHNIVFYQSWIYTIAKYLLLLVYVITIIIFPPLSLYNTFIYDSNTALLFFLTTSLLPLHILLSVLICSSVMYRDTPFIITHADFFFHAICMIWDFLCSFKLPWRAFWCRFSCLLPFFLLIALSLCICGYLFLFLFLIFLFIRFFLLCRHPSHCPRLCFLFFACFLFYCSFSSFWLLGRLSHYLLLLLLGLKSVSSVLQPPQFFCPWFLRPVV